jgi:WXG100 family type VII secretion target
MSDERIRMNFEAMEEMAKAFKEGAQDIQEMETKVRSAAEAIENGALRGKTGGALGDKLRDDLAPAMLRLKGKLEELEKDIREAVEQMRDADEIAGDYYKGS